MRRFWESSRTIMGWSSSRTLEIRDIAAGKDRQRVCFFFNFMRIGS